jgi:hypothetical protein
VPQGRYDKLSIVHRATCHGEGNLKTYLSKKSNRDEYAAWIKRVIIEETKPGQEALIVCKKVLVDKQNIPGPFPKNPAAIPSPTNPSYGWDIDGRHVGVTYWGGPGLGSNAWKSAEVVFLFDDYFLPRRANVANTQGLLMEPTSSGVLALMDALKTKSAEVDLIGEGHLLRWIRQMALRGRGRVFDEDGVCGGQKVVITGGRGSLERLVLHKDRLFPGAKLTISHTSELSNYTHREALLIVLSDPTLPNEVPATGVGKLLGAEWGNISSSLMTSNTENLVNSIGWTYIRGKGRGGSRFKRV